MASRRSPLIKYTQLFINNQFADSVKGKRFPCINPATGAQITEISEAEKEDVDLAVKAARAAFNRGAPWRTMDASARGNLITKLAGYIERDLDYLASLETLDNGKPYGDAQFDMKCVIDVFNYYAGWCDKIHGKTIPSDGNLLTYTRQEPVGVVGCIIPWNYPALMLSWKLGPALAAGCTVVVKPAEQTPLTALYIASLIKEAGFPSGVVNVVPGMGAIAGAAVASHCDIDKVAFTGSTQVGKLVMEAAAKSNLKRVSLELGGKSPLVIFEDANVEEAVNIAHGAVFSNHGQNCCAGSRTFVHEKIYDEFVKKAKEAALKRKVGDPFADGTQQGPQIDAAQQKKILELIESGKQEGAQLECGGDLGSDQPGYYIQPTVFSAVTDEMRIAREEVKSAYKSFAIKLSNMMGSMRVNCYDQVVPQAPFGGFKQSGFGRELGEDSLKEYTEVKTVSIQIPTNKN
ncbi:hypothetical protein B566_EDAN003690 [Ephemera danica]|nr:hypothetical protein B566_EDAN003690 [Ephemera danica]